jgi:hypothetical protein
MQGRGRAYTLRELSRKVGWSKERVERMLRSNGVPIHTMGDNRKRFVLASEIAMEFSGLYDSIVTSNEED